MPTFQPSSHSYGGISHADDSYGVWFIPAAVAGLTRAGRSAAWKCDHYQEKKQKAWDKYNTAKDERDEARRAGKKSKASRKQKDMDRHKREAESYDTQIEKHCSKAELKQSRTDAKLQEFAPAPVDSAGASLPPVVEEGGLPGWVLPVAGIGVLAVVGIGAALALRR
jgi:hypothetical protein